MTPKEKIYKRILETRNRINAIKGDEKQYNIIDECLDVAYVRNRTIAELNDELDCAQRQLYQLQIADRVKAWELTSEGKEAVCKANTSIQQIQRDVEERVAETEDRLQTFLAFNIGHRWKPLCLGLPSVRLAYCNKDGKPIFGHEVSVSFDKNFGDRRLRFGYGSFGSFDPTDDDDRVSYLCGMAELCKSENAKELKDILFSFADWMDVRRNEINKYHDMLNHPECYYPDFFNDIKKEWL